MSNGKITQIIGAVIDVEFPENNIPNIYDALIVIKTGLTLEVQQQLGDNVVRAIAMGSSEGLKRSLEVSNTGSAIKVPVGTKTLGRIMNVLGEPIDNAPIMHSMLPEHLVHRYSPSDNPCPALLQQPWVLTEILWVLVSWYFRTCYKPLITVEFHQHHRRLT